MFETGFLQLGRIRGAPIRIHWSVALGLLFFTGFRFEPGAWLGFIALILVHELGHAALVLRYRLRVVSLDVHGFGGECRWSGNATAWERAAIAWGGVLAQLVLFVATFAFVHLTGGPVTRFGAELAYVFTETNLWVMAINLLPVPPLDGSNAWSIISLWKARRASAGRRSSARKELQRIEQMDYARGGLSDEDEARVRRLFESAASRESRESRR
jgi:stage IV sporulation protein FB